MFWQGGSSIKRILLLGDSYAAHLYPGLKAVLGDDANIDQLTSNACAPILDLYNKRRPNCRELNYGIYSQASKGAYSTIIIAANWEGYPDISGLKATLNKVVKSKVEHIILFGPPPHWNNTLPRELFSNFMSHRNTIVPKRLASGLSEATKNIDERLSVLAMQAGIEYISILGLFCSDDGCLARVGDTANDLISGDEGHLTRAGSRTLFEMIKNNGLTPSIY
jgi:hypothetical protein